ncbi:MAG: hypothetical protein KAI81_06055 [Candidatus Marinimicrobia bacterium]|nr:hypothetical protein [Candidatus Neomarinimicrobiota bacterium]
MSDYQKNMVLYYTEQRIKWTFAGTTYNYTPILIRKLEEKGIDYPDLLPVELKKRYLEKQRDKQIYNKDAAFHLFLYADGAISDKYIQEKARFSFDKCKDKIGFDWSKGYSPDNKVKKDGWTAGFNKNGVWERLDLDTKPLVIDAKTGPDPSMFFTNRMKENKNNIGFVTIPESDDVILFDHYSKLKDGKEEKYYSITGEIY